jgi:hypothetical protein
MRFSCLLWLFRGSVSWLVLYVRNSTRVLIPSSKALAAWAKLVISFPCSMAERPRLMGDVAMSMGRWIASHSDHLEYKRNMARVRSSSPSCTSMNVQKKSLSIFKSVLLRGQDDRSRFMVYFYHSSVLSPLSRWAYADGTI